MATNICKLNIELEDRLVLKLIQAIQEIVAGEPKDAKDTEEPVNVFDTHKIDLKPSIDVKDKLFFEDFILDQGELKISLLTTGKIDEDLVPIKKSIGEPKRRIVKIDLRFFIFIVDRIIITVELTHSKTILENLKIKPQPAALDFENLS